MARWSSHVALGRTNGRSSRETEPDQRRRRRCLSGHREVLRGRRDRPRHRNFAHVLHIYIYTYTSRTRANARQANLEEEREREKKMKEDEGDEDASARYLVERGRLSAQLEFVR